MIRLEKVIIVTGGATGLGKCLAKQLHTKFNYKVIIVGRTLETLVETTKELTETGYHCSYYVLDITNEEQVQLFVNDLQQKHEVYGLVNNAGVGIFGSFLHSSKEQLESMLQTNVIGTYLITKYILPTMQDGFIMNIISTAGLVGKPNEALYCASKFAISGLVESLQKEFTDLPIHIQAVYMGGMNTPFWDHSDHIKDKSRLASPCDVATYILEQFDSEKIIVPKNLKK